MQPQSTLKLWVLRPQWEQQGYNGGIPEDRVLDLPQTLFFLPQDDPELLIPLSPLSLMLGSRVHSTIPCSAGIEPGPSCTLGSTLTPEPHPLALYLFERNKPLKRTLEPNSHAKGG